MPKALMFAVAATCTATIAAGWVEGKLSNRWGTPPDLIAAGECVARVPERVGDWELQSSEPFEDETLQMLQCAGYLSRSYKNVLTGDIVRVALLVGPPGPTAVHTPEICYSSRGQTIVQQRKSIATRPQQRPDESLWRMVFRSNDVEQNRFSVVYGWADAAGQWRASVNPRYEHGGASMLFKIQVAAPLADPADEQGPDVCQQFLRDFLPALDATLFSTSSPSSSSV
ncbi:MAG TPA: exosortase-associated EpsI family protein [Pirellulales bacterium]